ncbi:MAG: IS200/IS605 family transposase [Phycisphaerae bacterium]|nr:IS200/IS605 family transposase [Phycisphaerae bacterium]
MSFTNLLYHAVFSTKERRPAIVPDLRSRLYEYTGGIFRGEGGTQLEIGGIADHLHILFKMRPDQCLSDLMRLLKTNSSAWARERSADWPGWQDQYSGFTVSESQVGAVRQYIATQEEHHRKMSFRDELIALLRKHNIEFEEQYI